MSMVLGGMCGMGARWVVSRIVLGGWPHRAWYEWSMEERALAPHPSLKPQGFLRPLVRGVLPLGEGVVLDPFCGAGSTLAAAEAVGCRSIGIESDSEYLDMACQGIPRLRNYQREQADMFQAL